MAHVSGSAMRFTAPSFFAAAAICGTVVPQLVAAAVPEALVAPDEAVLDVPAAAELHADSARAATARGASRVSLRIDVPR
ncbi:hypothetical protein CELD12_32530 [Cellulomonas sp. NTE-D12]|nr:hypothetical protein CELD12_32530 [Cellulomonas sp. NTE-D12]